MPAHRLACWRVDVVKMMEGSSDLVTTFSRIISPNTSNLLMAGNVSERDKTAQIAICRLSFCKLLTFASVIGATRITIFPPWLMQNLKKRQLDQINLKTRTHHRSDKDRSRPFLDSVQNRTPRTPGVFVEHAPLERRAGRLVAVLRRQRWCPKPLSVRTRVIRRRDRNSPESHSQDSVLLRPCCRKTDSPVHRLFWNKAASSPLLPVAVFALKTRKYFRVPDDSAPRPRHNWSAWFWISTNNAIITIIISNNDRTRS